MKSTMMAIAMAGAATAYTVDITCDFKPLVDGQIPVLKGTRLPGGCMAVPSDLSGFNPTGTDMFADLGITATGGATIVDIVNPGATFTHFNFGVQAGTNYGFQTIESSKGGKKVQFVVYGDKASIQLDCGPQLREKGDTLSCKVDVFDSSKQPVFVKSDIAVPTLNIDDATYSFDTQKEAYSNSFTFTYDMIISGVYKVDKDGVSKQINCVAEPGQGTTVACIPNELNIREDQNSTCTITSDELAIGSDHFAPYADDLSIFVNKAVWDMKPSKTFEFKVSAINSNESGAVASHKVYVKQGLSSSFQINVIDKISNSKSTLVCDATKAVVGSSIECTSTPRGESGAIIEFKINSYKVSSTSDRGGIASGMDCGVYTDVTPRTPDGLGTEFKFRVKVDDRSYGLMQSATQSTFETLAAAQTECKRDGAADLCTREELDHVKQMKYYERYMPIAGSKYSFVKGNTTYMFRITGAGNVEETEANKDGYAHCCTAKGSLNGKKISLVDGIVDPFNVLPVTVVASDPNTPTNIAAGDVSISYKDATWRIGAPNAVVVSFNGKFVNLTRVAISIGTFNATLEQDNWRSEVTIPYTVPKDDINKTITVTVSVDGKVLQTKSFEAIDSKAPTSAPTSAPTASPTSGAPTSSSPTATPTTAEPTTLTPTASPTTSSPSSAPTSRFPTVEGHTYAPTAGPTTAASVTSTTTAPETTTGSTTTAPETTTGASSTTTTGAAGSTSTGAAGNTTTEAAGNTTTGSATASGVTSLLPSSFLFALVGAAVALA